MQCGETIGTRFWRLARYMAESASRITWCALSPSTDRYRDAASGLSSDAVAGAEWGSWRYRLLSSLSPAQMGNIGRLSTGGSAHAEFLKAGVNAFNKIAGTPEEAVAHQPHQYDACGLFPRTPGLNSDSGCFRISSNSGLSLPRRASQSMQTGLSWMYRDVGRPQ